MYLQSMLSILAISLATSSHAAVLAGYEFTGIDTTLTTFAATTLGTNISGSAVTSGTGFKTNDGDRFIINYNGANPGPTNTVENALASNSYISFTLSATAGYSLSLSSVSFNLGDSNPEADFALVSNVTGYNTASIIPLAGPNVSLGIITSSGGNSGGPGPVYLNGSTYTADLSSISAFQGMADGASVEFRIVGFKDPNVNQYMFWGITQKSGDDLVINGSVAPIPEPSTCLLLGLAGTVVLTMRRRRVRA